MRAFVLLKMDLRENMLSQLIEFRLSTRMTVVPSRGQVHDYVASSHGMLRKAGTMKLK